ncbi:MAG: hypothetical protein UMR38_05710 [Candidatus Izemoplasma sp.]|nr:hypothetical protein [Candidatus Izemoplasma sp.]
MTIDTNYLKQAIFSKLTILPFLVPGILTSIFLIVFDISFYPILFVVVVAGLVKAYPFLVRGYPFQKKMIFGLAIDIGLAIMLVYYHPVWMWIVVAILILLMIVIRALFDTVAYSQLSNSLNDV